jgi:hypothetical protein
LGADDSEEGGEGRARDRSAVALQISRGDAGSAEGEYGSCFHVVDRWGVKWR